MADTLIQLQQGAKSFGARRLFDEASFSVNEGEHVGVIGPNGAGKSTLFKILTGEESMDSGQVIKSRGLRLGYLAQHDDWSTAQTVEDYLQENATMALWELKSLGRGLGLAPEIYDRPVGSLSGGYRMRIKLLRLLGQHPNLMLLDEPTNYLDLETLMVLENFLQGYDGAFMLISHDREFLRRTTDHIIEVEAGDITKYNGNIDDYFEQKALLRSQLEARAMSLAEKRKEILDFVARFGAKATKASQAQSRLKQLDRMETIEVKALPVTAKIHIPQPERTGKLIINMKDAELGYPERSVIKGAQAQVLSGDHVAVVGLNGAGKSTLLKTLSGELELKSGVMEHGYQVTIGYYAQHVAERLKPHHTVAEAMGEKAHSSVLPQDVLNLAGSLLFSGDDVRKKISVLSGGEKARVALGQILLQKASCLILDEPTNHLDFQTVEALTQALNDYSGTVIVVSHDRGFIRRVGSKILEVRDGALNLYHGTYDDYVWKIQKLVMQEQDELRTTASAKPAAKASSEVSLSSNAQWREAKKALEKELRSLEKKLSDGDVQMANLQAKIAETESIMATRPLEASKLVKELNQLNVDLHNLEEQWMQWAERKEQLTAELAQMAR